MTKKTKLGLAVAAVLSAGVVAVSQLSVHAENEPKETADLLLTIVEGDLTIGVGGETSEKQLTLTLNGDSGDAGIIHASSKPEVAKGTFSDNFWLEDLKGDAKGYYTTLDVTDLLGENLNKTITKDNVSITVDNVALLDENGMANDQVDGGDVTTKTAFGTQPLTYINRAENTTAGILGKYGDAPDIEVTIPANTPADTYKGTITYTLYDRALNA